MEWYSTSWEVSYGGESGHQDPQGPHGEWFARAWRGGGAEDRPDAVAGRDGHDGLFAVRADGGGEGPGGLRRPVRGPQHYPAGPQEPRRPPLLAGVRRKVWHVLLAARERHLPLPARRALRQTRRDPDRGRLPHHHIWGFKLYRHRGRRARRSARHGRPALRDPSAQGRRCRAYRGATGLGDAEGRDPGASTASWGAGRPRARLRVLRARGRKHRRDGTDH